MSVERPTRVNRFHDVVLLSDSVSLYRGDCFDILPGLGEVGQIVTSPPFNCLIADGCGCGRLMLSCEFHGDHDEDWIIETRDGVEIARHNVRYVETIQWADALKPNVSNERRQELPERKP